MQLNFEVSLICFRISSSKTSALFVVADISVVAIATVAVVVDIIGMLRVRGTVDTHRLLIKPLDVGVNIGAAIPN